MKLVLLLAVLLFAAKTGYGTPVCAVEVEEYVLLHIGCSARAIEIQGLVKSYSKNKTTYAEIETNINEICKTANSTQCYNDVVTPILGPCNESKRLQHFRNALRVVLTYNEFMCQNNGTQLLDFIKDGGASCYLHSNKTRCFKNAKVVAAIEGDHYFKDETICKILEADLSCHHHYEECQNPNVNIDYLLILTKLKERFHCTSI